MPEEQKAIALSPAEQERMIVNTIAIARNEPDDYKLTPEDLEAIEEGIADFEAGRTIPAEEVFAAVRERYGWNK